MIQGLFSGTNYVASTRLLDATALRQKAITSNIANVDTPDYKRVDLRPDFEKGLRQAIERGDVERLRASSPSLQTFADEGFIRGDGNNVELDNELLEMNRNTLQHEFLTQFLSGRYSRLKGVIAGRTS
jgi:flagellar basal-body rod protein FlgB